MDGTLTVAIMDAPYEAAASTTALRIIASALRKGINVNVFAYEGAVSLTMKDQAPHANPVKGTSVEEEDHPTTKDLVAALVELGRSEPKRTWVNCGLCVDERGAVRLWLRAGRAGADRRDDPLRRGEAFTRRGGDLRRPLERARLQRGRRHHAVHHAHAQRLAGVNGPAGQQEIAAVRAAGDVEQARDAVGGIEAERDLGQAEARATGGHA